MKKLTNDKHITIRVENNDREEMEALRSKGLNWSALIRQYIKKTIAENRDNTALEIISK